LATDQGIKKTIKHFKNNEYVNGIKSLTGDLLNATPIIGTTKALNYG
jgi:hypothetical protein